MQIEKVYFNSVDNLNLIGLLHTPKKKTDTVVISIHGITSNCLKRRDDILAQKCTDLGIAYFCFNNRGHEIICNYGRIEDNNMHFYGSGAESIYDSYFDIKGAMLEMQKRGYSKIILQGHSMGCTKTVYTYNEFLNNNETTMLDAITGVILLSMVDIPTALKEFLGKDYKKIISYFQLLKKRGKGDKLVVLDDNTPPVRPNSILEYAEDNKKIDFAKFGDNRTSFKELNNIKVPLFMRWGNVNELIFQSPNEIVNKLNEKIKNENKDISYIKGANHNYTGKEEELAEEIEKFIKKYDLNKN